MEIKKLYQDPKFQGSFTGRKRFYQAQKQINPSVSFRFGFRTLALYAHSHTYILTCSFFYLVGYEKGLRGQ